MRPWRAEVNRCGAGEGEDEAWAAPAGEVRRRGTVSGGGSAALREGP